MKILSFKLTLCATFNLFLNVSDYLLAQEIDLSYWVNRNQVEIKKLTVKEEVVKKNSKSKKLIEESISTGQAAPIRKEQIKESKLIKPKRSAIIDLEEKYFPNSNDLNN